MTIDIAKDKNKVTMTFSGRIDTSTAPKMEATVKDNIAGITELIMDMKQLEYISSAGLRILLSAQKIMKKQGSMTLINVPDNIMEILEVTGFTEILTIL